MDARQAPPLPQRSASRGYVQLGSAVTRPMGELRSAPELEHAEPTEEEKRVLNELLSEWNRELGGRRRFLQRVFRSALDEEKEEKLCSILLSIPIRVLSHFLKRVRLGAVLSMFKGAAVCKMLNILAAAHDTSFSRMPMLSTEAKCLVLHAIQAASLSIRADCYIRNLILSEQRSRLLEVKTILDTRGSHLNLRRLIFNDVRDAAMREEILQHFLFHSGAVMPNDIVEGGPLQKARACLPPTWCTLLKVLSDIDDTLSCSGGPPGGCDKRYPDGVVYPGIIRLYYELDMATDERVAESAPPTTSGNVEARFVPLAPVLLSDDDDEDEDEGDENGNGELGAPDLRATLVDDGYNPAQQLPLDYEVVARAAHQSPMIGQGNLTFLTARPHLVGGLSERASFRRFRQLMSKSGLHCLPNLLSGNMKTSMPVLLGNMTEMSKKKLRNFEQYQQLYPEYGVVFIGDNGQGDVFVAEQMAQHYPNHFRAAFIHRVAPIAECEVEIAAQRNIFYVGTYIDAALHAQNRQLISANAVYRVAKAALADLNAILPRFKSHRQFDFVAQMYERALDNVNRLMESKGVSAEPLILTRPPRSMFSESEDDWEPPEDFSVPHHPDSEVQPTGSPQAETRLPSYQSAVDLVTVPPVPQRDRSPQSRSQRSGTAPAVSSLARCDQHGPCPGAEKSRPASVVGMPVHTNVTEPVQASRRLVYGTGASHPPPPAASGATGLDVAPQHRYPGLEMGIAPAVDGLAAAGGGRIATAHAVHQATIPPHVRYPPQLHYPSPGVHPHGCTSATSYHHYGDPRHQHGAPPHHTGVTTRQQWGGGAPGQDWTRPSAPATAHYHAAVPQPRLSDDAPYALKYGDFDPSAGSAQGGGAGRPLQDAPERPSPS